VSLTPYVDDGDFRFYCGDALDVLCGIGEVDAVVTSPPYLDARPDVASRV
jgi:hypothetical protein